MQGGHLLAGLDGVDGPAQGTADDMADDPTTICRRKNTGLKPVFFIT
jgi:hypothetical protein